MTGEKTGQVAKRLDIHPNTVRSYADRYSDLLSEQATGRKRKFTHEDTLLIATVAHFRDRGMGWDQIEDALNAGQRVDTVPELPTPEVEYARAALDLVPKPTHDLEIERRLRVEKELSETRAQLDKVLAQAEQERSEIRSQWQSEVTTLRDRIATLEHEKGLLEGQLTERKSSQYWLAIIAAVVVVVIIIVVVLMRGVG